MRLSPCLRGAALVACLCVALFHPPAGAQTTLSAQDAFEAGIEQAESGHHREAIAFFQLAYQANPEGVGVLWNLGLSSAELGEHREALKYWLAFQKLRPQEWRAQAKLIQTYQALGDTAARDKVRDELLAKHRAVAPDSDLGRNEMYCREQMVVAGRKILAFEYFEPKGARRVFYAFIILNQEDPGKEDYRYSLGSYDSTTQIAWETGSLSRDKRIYHLDKYEAKSHWTYGLYEEPQSYEAVRARVVEAMNGRAQPLSGTSVR